MATADSDNSGYLDYAEFYTRFAEEPAQLLAAQTKTDLEAKRALIAADRVARNLDPVVELGEGEEDDGSRQVLDGIAAEAATDDVALAVAAVEEEESTGLLLATQMNTHDIIHVGDIFPLRGGHAAVHGRNFVSTGTGSTPTVSCRGIEAVAGRWYYEVTVLNAGHAVIGWAANAFRLSRGRKRGAGVGDCAHSWGLGCYSSASAGAAAAGGEASPSDAASRGSYIAHAGTRTTYGNVWQAGDVIGVLLDATAGTLAFALNGELLGDATPAVQGLPTGTKLLPVVTFDHTFQFKLNIGFEPFRFMPLAGYTSLRRLAQRVMEDKCVRQAGPSCGKLIATSGDSGLDIDGMRLSSRSGFPSAIAAGILLTSGKWYYEIVLESDGLGQLGWADMEFVGDSGYGRGCGDDKHSWGFDGMRVLWWHNGQQSWGKKWRDGDILGCAVDLDERTISWSLNGSWDRPMGQAFVNFQYTAGVVPALTLQRFGCTVNWGRDRLRHRGPTPEYRSVWQWLVEHKPSLAAGARSAASMPPAGGVPLMRGVSTAYTAAPLDDLAVVPLRVASGYGKCTVTGSEVSNAVRLCTVTTDRVHLRRGKWYFEFTTRVPPSVTARICVGWVDRHFHADWTSERGVGDDRHSWGFVVPTGTKRFDGDATQLTSTRVGFGAVVGCLCDLDARTVSFSVNGRWLGDDATAVTAGDAGDDDVDALASVPGGDGGGLPVPAFTGVNFDRELLPAVSIIGDSASGTFNLGQAPFKYAPAGARGVHFALPNPAPVPEPTPSAAAAVTPDHAEGPEPWACGVCTFLNEVGSTTCSMCGLPKGSA